MLTQSYSQQIVSDLAIPRVKHIKLKSFEEGTNNNILERLNCTVRERTKVMRGLDNDESAQRFADGNRIYYNVIRAHQGLKGETPAEKAGIDLKLEGNKWKELIKRAKHDSGKLRICRERKV